jgi:hypothetical protein
MVSEAVGSDQWPSGPRVGTLVNLDSVWKYWDRGSVPTTNWRDNNYDDSEWEEGPAPIGYGEEEGILATEVSYGGKKNDKHITTLFRHTFTAPGNENLKDLWVRLQVDDGCVVYLNGKEICRVGMGDQPWPGASVPSVRKAERSGEKEFFHFRIPDAWRLRGGMNTIAVRVHQATKSSSDIRLALEFAAKKKAGS